MAEFRHTVHFVMEEDGVCNTEVRKIFKKNFRLHSLGVLYTSL